MNKKEYNNILDESSSESDNSTLTLSLSASSSSIIYEELLSKQIKNIPVKWRLSNSDIWRICKYVKSSLFGDKCVIWEGYITNSNNNSKGPYVNFYHNGKKIAIHRLLYSNFVSILEDDEYIKFNCDNKGFCCNVNHYDKYRYRNKTNPSEKIEKKKKSSTSISVQCSDVIVEFI